MHQIVAVERNLSRCEVVKLPSVEKMMLFWPLASLTNGSASILRAAQQRPMFGSFRKLVPMNSAEFGMVIVSLTGSYQEICPSDLPTGDSGWIFGVSRQREPALGRGTVSPGHPIQYMHGVDVVVAVEQYGFGQEKRRRSRMAASDFRFRCGGDRRPPRLGGKLFKPVLTSKNRSRRSRPPSPRPQQSPRAQRSPCRRRRRGGRG